MNSLDLTDEACDPTKDPGCLSLMCAWWQSQPKSCRFRESIGSAMCGTAFAQSVSTAIENAPVLLPNL